MPTKVWDEITYPFPNFAHVATVEVWEWISNSTPHFIIDIITYPSWDLSQPMLVKGARIVKGHFTVSSNPRKYGQLCAMNQAVNNWGRVMFPT